MFTSKVAGLEANGKTYAEVAEERGVTVAEQSDGAARQET
jgi:hypothetical protein